MLLNFISKPSTTNHSTLVLYVYLIHGGHLIHDDHVTTSLGNWKRYTFIIIKLQFTLDSTLTVFFGMDSGILKGSPNAIGTAFDAAQRAMMKLLFSSIPAITLSGLAPWPFAGLNKLGPVGTAGLALSFHQNPHHKTFRDAIKVLDSEIYPIIRELRSTDSTHEQEEEESKENMDVKSTNSVSASQRRNNNLTKLFMQDPSFSDAELRDIVLNMIIAGRDTTSNALSWLTSLLCQNAEAQKKLCDEVDAAVLRIKEANGDDGTPVVPTLEHVSAESMPYLNGCVYEALRLFPPVPFDAKVVVEECDIPFGLGGRLLAGTRIAFCPFAMGRDPEIYPEPLAFKPERWIPFKAPSPYEFPVFQGGPRSCLGQDMAMFEMKLLMTVLMQKRSFDLKEGEAEHLTPSLMLTIAVCNSKQKMGTGEDTFNLWVHPRDRS
jgi:cytochrome P450